VIAEYAAFLTLFRQGKCLADSATWKNRTVATNLLVGVIGALLVIAKAFGYDVHIDHDTIEALAGGVAAAVAVGNSVMHVITSDKVGLPAVGGAGDRGGAGPRAGDPA
jgi:uncharacterized membrane protein